MNNRYVIDPLIKDYKDISDLIDAPVVIRVTDFDDEDADEFSKLMSKAHRTGQPVIPILIDSYGGRVYSLLSMVADIEHSRLPVATIAVGKAMSCGAVLLTCGADGMRYMDKNAAVMIHDVSAMSLGKNEEIKASAKQIDRLQKQVFHLMAKNCGHPVNYFLDIIHERSHAEWYLTANEAKKLSIRSKFQISTSRYQLTCNSIENLALQNEFFLLKCSIECSVREYRHIGTTVKTYRDSTTVKTYRDSRVHPHAGTNSSNG